MWTIKWTEEGMRHLNSTSPMEVDRWGRDQCFKSVHALYAWAGNQRFYILGSWLYVQREGWPLALGQVHERRWR